MKHIDLTICLTGSALFDTHALYTSKLLASTFPTLERKVNPASITITGDLPDDEYEKWMGLVYNKGIMAMGN